jgi:hypothetical protein
MRAGTLLLGLVATSASSEPLPAPSRLGIGGAGYAVTIRVHSDREAGAALRAGEDLRLTLAYREAAGGRPVTGVRPRAWVRRLAEEGAPGCADAAWIVRASGAISPNDLPMDRAYLVAIAASTDGSAQDRVAVVDLHHHLKSANQISLTPLEARIREHLVHPSRPSLLATRPRFGDIVAVGLPWGGFTVWASGLRDPGALAPLGANIVVVEEHPDGRLVVLDPQGATVGATGGLGPMPRRLLPSGRDTVVALSADGSAIVLRDGQSPIPLAPASVGGVAAAGGGVLLSSGNGAELRIRWLDDPRRAISIALPFEVGGLAMGTDGRFGLAWNRDGRQAVPIDLASSRTLAPISLPGTIAEAASVGTALVLIHSSVPVATVVDFASVRAIRSEAPAPAVQRVHLARTSAATDAGTRLIGGEGRSAAAYLQPGTGAVAMIAAGGGPASQTVPGPTFRGDGPHSIAWFDQRLETVEPGTFSTVLRLAWGGRYQVVTTTGPGGTSACSSFGIEGPPAPSDVAASLKLLAAPGRVGEEGVLRLRFDNRPQRLSDGPIALRVHDLEFGISFRLAARLSGSLLVSAVSHFPRPGTYAVSIDAAGLEVAPIVVGIAP